MAALRRAALGVPYFHPAIILHHVPISSILSLSAPLGIGTRDAGIKRLRTHETRVAHHPPVWEIQPADGNRGGAG